MDEEKLKLLYEAVSKDYSVGSYEEFSGKMGDSTKRKAFYDGVGKEYDLGSYEDFETKIAPPAPVEPEPTYGTKQLEEVAITAPKKDDGFWSDTWNTFASSLNKAYAGVADIPKIVYELAAIPQNFIADQLPEGELKNTLSTSYAELLNETGKASTPLKLLDQVSQHYRGESEAYNKEVTKFEGDIYNSIKNGKLGDAGRQVANAITGSVPSLLQLYATAGLGQAANLSTISKTALNALPFASNKLAEIEDNPDIKNYQKPIVAAFNGLSEVVFEQAFGSKAIIDDIVRDLGRDGIDVAKRKATEFAEGYLKKIFAKNGIPVAFGKGGASEGLTQFTQNMLDKYSGLNPDLDLMQGVADAIIVGGVMDSGIQGAGNILGSVKNKQGRERVEQLTTEINELKADLDKTGSDAVSDVLEQKTEELSNLVEGAVTTEQKLTPEQRADTDILVQRADAITDILKDKTLSEVTKTTLQEELNQVEAELDSIITPVAENTTTEPITGVSDVYGSKDEIKTIGDEKQYETYVQNIFPESKVNAVMYHQTTKDFDLKSFDKSRTMYFTSSKQGHFSEDGKTISVVVNLKNPKYVDANEITRKTSKELVKEYEDQGYDGLIATPEIYEQRIKDNGLDPKDYADDLKFPEVLVFNPEQIHELGSEADVESFKEYERSKNTSNIESEIIVPEQRLTVTEQKLTEIQARRAEITKRLSDKLSNINTGINPDAIKDLVELGVTYVEEGVIRFKDFADRMRQDLGKTIPDEQLRDIYRQSAEQLGYGVRGFGERVRTDETTPTETAELLDNTEQLYQTQDYAEIRSRLSTMDDLEKQRLVGELSAVTSQLTSEQNIGVLAGIELINKYNSEGNFDEASKIIETLSKSATVAAQTLRQYGEFKSSTPDGYIQLVEKWLDKVNKKLTEPQKTKIKELFANQQQAAARVEEALNKVTETLDDADYKDYYANEIAYEDAIRDLEDYIDNIRGKNLPDTLAKILQGNLLSFKSVVINPFANLMQFGLRGTENDVATAVDALVGLITSRRTKSPTLSADNIRLGSRAVVQGSKRATRKAVRGTANAELAKYDVGGRLKPRVAFNRLFENLKSSATREENQYGWSQGLSDFTESTIGVPANLMFRLLPFGDDPFFEQAKTQRLVEIGKNDKGLEGDALERFVLKPDAKSLEEATNYGKEATFQEENVISRNINRLIGDGAKRIEEIGGTTASASYRFIMKGILPFVNTPSSIALKTVKFAVPAIPFSQAIYDATQLTKAYKMKDSKLKETLIRRHQKDFSEHMGQAIVSGAVLGAATILVANGLATGDLPEDKFQKKQKDFMFATQPPNTINVDGVKRLLNGEDFAYKQGDRVVSYVPLGLIGAQIGIVSSTKGEQLREQKKKADVVNTKGEAYYPEAGLNPLNFIGNFATNAPAAMRYFFNQSFVQGAETILSAVSTPDGAKNIIPQLGKTFVTMGIPNTVSQTFRASNDYMRDLYTDDQLQTFANIIKEKVGNVEDLPIKYDMWGKPIKQTPDGSNPYVYQIIDIFRSQKILQDPITYAVFDIQRKTRDDGAIPNSIDDTFTKKDFKVKLDKEQKSELTKMVGQERRKLVERILKNYTDKTDPERMIPRLKSAYSRGAAIAKSKFRRKIKI
jgi:hypothetical protein